MTAAWFFGSLAVEAIGVAVALVRDSRSERQSTGKSFQSTVQVGHAR